MTVVTYPAIIRNGKAEPLTPLDLPEGSEVYIVLQRPLEQRTACKKATGWLVDEVGNLLMVDDGVLIQQEERWVWRFLVYLTSLSHEPYGPIGQMDVDADTGKILNDQTTITQLYKRGQAFLHPIPTAH